MSVLDLQNGDTPTAYSCDIAIVGAGAVGIALAAELSRRGRRVILLEAGGLSLEAQSQGILTNARSTGFKHDGLHSGRFRLLGGTTNFWGGQLVPFDPIVFEDRPWLPAAAWPFDRDVLQAYYERALSLLGMDGGEADDEDVWKRAKTEVPDFGSDLELFLTRWVKTPNFAKMFKTELASPSLQVLLHANVVGLQPDESGRRIAAVHVRTFGGRKAVVTAQRTILACGTMEIARLLMLPYADGSTTPWQDNPWLGRAYLDHLDSTAGEAKPLDGASFHDLFDNLFFDGYKYNPKIKLTEQAQRDRKLVGAAGSFIFRTSYQENAETIKIFLRAIRDGRLPPKFWELPAHVLALSKIAIPFALRYLRANRTFHPSSAAILFRVTLEQIPQRDSRIQLRTERDALDMPMIDVNWKVDGREIETIAHFATEVRDRLKTLGLADLQLDPKLVARDPAYLQGASDTFHQMGGARMGSDRSDGVVDRDLAVFGIEDLYVAGAAVFPSTGFPNCTLTAIALGLRLCDRLVGLAAAANDPSVTPIRQSVGGGIPPSNHANAA
jgi:choline dehydrogenase-like flavoprotein